MGPDSFAELSAVSRRRAMMSCAERVGFVDAAMRSGASEAFLDGARRGFESAGRDGDALTAAVLRTLLRMGEIETVMHMRAEWRGERAPARRQRDRPR